MRKTDRRAVTALPRRRQVGLPLTRSGVGKHPPGNTLVSIGRNEGGLRPRIPGGNRFSSVPQAPVRTGACAIRHCTTVQR